MIEHTVLTAGDTVLIIDFGNRVDLAISAKVLALADRINEREIRGVIETVPTIRSLSIYYEPLSISATQLERLIAEIIAHLEEAGVSGRAWNIPVCYDSQFAPDLDEVAARCNLSPAQVIEMHSSRTYHVYMLGFLPGLAYLGDLPHELELSRRETPRSKVAKGSLGIGGKLTCIYPMATPCGWHLMGRSPVSLWNLTLTPSALLRAGDRVKFQPISLREYERLCPGGVIDEPQSLAR